jgi:SAM-dependent methyltransferase
MDDSSAYIAQTSTAQTSTAESSYTARLQRLEGARWRQLLNVQAPYRWNIHRLRLGRTLDVGCGLGRNLAYLDRESVGVDHNPDSVAIARAKGLNAFTSDEFSSDAVAAPGQFDSMLLAHVVEHMTADEAAGLISNYLPSLRAGGRVCFITPQERGFATDATHVQFTDFAALRALADRVGLALEREFSFPFPRSAGRLFTYNEFVVTARLAP